MRACVRVCVCDDDDDDDDDDNECMFNMHTHNTSTDGCQRYFHEKFVSQLQTIYIIKLSVILGARCSSVVR